MAQYSVYLRFAESQETAETHIASISAAWPGKGSLHIVFITDKQYENDRVFIGKKREKRSKNPEQFVLF